MFLLPGSRFLALTFALRRGVLLGTALLGALSAAAFSEPATANSPAPAPAPAPPFYIREYRVTGAATLPKIAVEEAVYPYLGPGRTDEDVEQARAALEKAYRDKGYQTVTVQIPAQPRRSVVFLQVVEGKVARLRVHGSRYFSLAEIKKRVPSLAPGSVPNFNDITRDIVGLNQLADRRVTPELKAGSEPGTVEIALKVKDTLPLHGSVELNNRYSADTSELRLNASASYNNLWQRGHSLGVSFQVAPQRPDDALVYSAFYLARLPDAPWLSFIVQGTKQDSNVSTLGGAAVAGRGEVVGFRTLITLPALKDFYHSLSVGFDYKHFDQSVLLGGSQLVSPITYFPLSIAYNATWVGKGWLTEFNGGLNFHLRGLGSDEDEFDNRRFRADGNYLYFRGDLSHSHDLPAGFQVFGKVQGQLASKALVDSEEFSGGGLGTVRGYLESEVLGDNALFGSLELRSPSISDLWNDRWVKEWRVYAFVDAGLLSLNDPLPEQESHFDLASIGFGSRIQLFDHLNGSIDAGLPLIGQAHTEARQPLLTFRVWAEF